MPAKFSFFFFENDKSVAQRRINNNDYNCDNNQYKNSYDNNNDDNNDDAVDKYDKNKYGNDYISTYDQFVIFVFI